MVRFIVGFAILVAAFYAVWVTDPFREFVFVPMLHLNATIGSHVLGWLGYGTISSGKEIVSPEYTVSIQGGCEAIEPIALFASALLAFPVPWRRKLIGLAVGACALLALNQVRIVSLFLIGVHAPDWFEFAHVEVWQILFLVLPFLCCLVAISWAGRTPTAAVAEPTAR